MSRATDVGAPRVTDATFIPAHGGKPMSIYVRGDNFIKRAVPLLARLGQQMVSRVVIEPGGRAFGGLVERPPRDGDRLYVGYADHDLVATPVVYRDESPPPRVA